MPSVLVRSLLILTSLAPVLWAFAFVYWGSDKSLSIGLILISLALVIVCHLILKWARTMVEVRTLRITSLKVADQEILAFVVAYLLPLASLESASLNIGLVIFVLGVLVFAVYYSSSYHFNPLLGLFFRYHFYEVSTGGGISYVLLSRRFVDSIESPIKCIRISQYLMLDVDKDGEG